MRKSIVIAVVIGLFFLIWQIFTCSTCTNTQQDEEDAPKPASINVKHEPAKTVEELNARYRGVQLSEREQKLVSLGFSPVRGHQVSIQ